MFDWQREVIESDARYKVIRCGRGAGKSVLEGTVASRDASRGLQVGWFAPSHKQAKVGWRTMSWLGRMAGARILESEREIHYPGGGFIQAWTTENPDALRSEGYDRAIFDEFCLMQPRVWAQIIRPRLRGGADFISTTRGKDHFYDLYRKADGGIPGWATWNFPTHANPVVPRTDLESWDPANHGPDAMSERDWRQEILAEFLDDEGEVFRNIVPCSTAQQEAPQPGATYYTFVDLAQVYDFNALSVVRVDGDGLRQVYCDRWNKTPWDVSQERIVAVGRRYRGHVAIDTTGDSYRDSLVTRLRAGLGGYSTVSGLKFTNANKQDMVRNLCAFLEQNQVQLLDPKSSEPAQIQFDELASYGAEVSRFGNVRYNAPEGKHDDMVVAVMASTWMARLRRGSSRQALERIGVL